MAFNTIIPYNNLPVFHFVELIKKDFHKRRLQGVIFGNFGALNYGDEAILAGQLQELQGITDCHITVIARFPEQVSRIHKIKAIGTTDITNILKTLGRADFVIVGGGGLFCRNDGGVKGFLFQLYTALFFVFFSLLLKKKAYILGIGIYSNMPKLLQPLVLQLLNHTPIVTVRDSHSYEYLKTKKISANFFKDNSYLMDVIQKTVLQHDALFKPNLHKKKYNIGFALKAPESIPERQRLIKEVIEFMNKNAEDTAFFFYSLDANIGYNNDKQFNEELIASVKRTSKKSYEIFTIPTDWHPNKVFGSFQLMDYMVAMRLHGSIFCYRLAVPFYGITYDTKCSSFLDSIGHTKYEIAEVSSKKMQEEFERVKISNI